MANSPNSNYVSVFGRERNIPQITQTHSGEPFNIKMIRKRLAAIGRNKLIDRKGFPREILKLGAETMILYLLWLLELTINNAAIPSDWKRTTVVPIYKEGDRSLVTNYRPVSLTSVVCKQMEHVIAGYLRQVCDTNICLRQGQHAFKPGYSRESQIVTVCQESWFPGWGSQDRRDNNLFFKHFRFCSIWCAAYKNCGLGSGFEDSRMDKEIPFRSFAEIVGGQLS